LKCCETSGRKGIQFQVYKPPLKHVIVKKLKLFIKQIGAIFIDQRAIVTIGDNWTNLAKGKGRSNLFQSQ